MRLILAAFIMDFALAMAGLATQYLGVYKLGAPNLVLGLFGTFGSAGYTIGCLFSGRLSDGYGRRTSVLLASLGMALLWGILPSLDSWALVLVLLPFCGIVMGFFWPPLQAWLAELSQGGRRGLTRNLGLFNLMWTTGLMLGPVVTGYLWKVQYRLSFYVPVLVVLLLAAWIRGTPKAAPESAGASPPAKTSSPEPADAAPPGENDLFLYLARIGNFGTWFAMGMILAMFPKLGAQVGFTPTLIGWLLFLFRFGQLAVFLWTRHEHRWQYRLWPMVVAQSSAVLALLGISVAHGAPAFAAAFIVVGVGGGLTYVNSLFYALHNRTTGRGRASGFHEAILGFGILAGPLVGGMLGQWVNLRAGFVAAACVLLAATLIQLAWYRRQRGIRR